MKKMMFDYRYGLTEAALNGTKIVTRRLIKVQPSEKIKVFDVSQCSDGYYYAGSY